MRGPFGVVAGVVTALLLVGAVALGLVYYNSDQRDRADVAAFDAAVTRASSVTGQLNGRDNYWGRIAIYPVLEDGTLHPVPEAGVSDIWSAFMRMVTPEFAAENMSALLIANAPDSPFSAVVERRSVRPLRWSLTINLASNLARDDYLRTLMHEYAHLLTLDDDQVDPTATHCLTTLLEEGCLFPLSTLERFENRFWQHVGEAAPDADSVSITEAWNRYIANTSDFLTVYAATNLVEDAAETFAEFVIRDRPSPESGTWAQKILFFWEQPEYVAIRAHIRDWFGSELPEPLLPVDNGHRG